MSKHSLIGTQKFTLTLHVHFNEDTKQSNATCQNAEKPQSI